MKASKPFTLANCTVEPTDLTLQFVNGDKLPLQPKFIEVLCYLAEHYPRVITREELIENVWDDNAYVGEKALNNAVWQLRKSLKGINGDDDVIKTIRKVGYKLLVEPIWQEWQERQDVETAQPIRVATPTKPKPANLHQYLPYALISFLGLLLLWSLFTRESVIEQPKVTQITKAPGSELFVAPSPDGRYVVYKWLSPDNKVNLYMQDCLHTELKPKQLTFDDYEEGHSVWSNDGQYLFFSRKNKADRRCEIIRLKVTSHQEQTLANCPMDGGYYYLDISPDDKTLAYHGYSEPADDAGIYFLDLTGADARPYRFSCANNCGYKDRDFAFSPDGLSIAVSRRSNRFNENIYLVDLVSKVAKPLTQGEEDIVGLSWHPNGKQIVYATQKADVRQGYILDIASKTRHELNIDGFSYPAFAKTSKALFFQQRQEKYHIVSLPLGESIASSPFPVVQSDFNHHYPDYSAASKRFVYVSNESGHYELWSANTDGSEREQLTHLKTTIRYPNWSHDGNKIAFLAPLPSLQGTQNAGGDNIYTLNLITRAVNSVPTPFKEHNRPTWSYDDTAVISAIYDNEFTDLYQLKLTGGPVKRLSFDGGRYAIMTSPTTMLYTRIKRGLWQKEIETNAPPLNKISGELFKTLYSWSYLTKDSGPGIYFRQNADDHHQINFYDLAARQLQPLVRLPKQAFENHGALTPVADDNKLLFTGTQFPQADIKLLTHPLIR